MEARIQTVTTVKLTLTESEASWLMDLMKNPLPDEEEFDRKTRADLWHVLNEAGVV